MGPNMRPDLDWKLHAKDPRHHLDFNTSAFIESKFATGPILDVDWYKRCPPVSPPEPIYHLVVQFCWLTMWIYCRLLVQQTPSWRLNLTDMFVRTLLISCFQSLLIGILTQPILSLVLARLSPSSGSGNRIGLGSEDVGMGSLVTSIGWEDDGLGWDVAALGGIKLDPGSSIPAFHLRTCG